MRRGFSRSNLILWQTAAEGTEKPNHGFHVSGHLHLGRTWQNQHSNKHFAHLCSCMPRWARTNLDGSPNLQSWTGRPWPNPLLAAKLQTWSLHHFRPWQLTCSVLPAEDSKALLSRYLRWWAMPPTVAKQLLPIVLGWCRCIEISWNPSS